MRVIIEQSASFLEYNEPHQIHVTKCEILHSLVVPDKYFGLSKTRGQTRLIVGGTHGANLFVITRELFES